MVPEWSNYDKFIGWIKFKESTIMRTPINEDTSVYRKLIPPPCLDECTTFNVHKRRLPLYSEIIGKTIAS